MNHLRTSTISRQTTATHITLSLNLDGAGQASISTGVGFLDHMLRHIAVHGPFDLDVHARGDLEIDPHHTVEDVALGLGQAFDQALGERHGIVRMSSAAVPYRKGLVVYRIIMRRDGSVRASAKMEELEPDAANHFRHTDPRYLRDEWCFFMWAKDRLSAIKIANERRAQLLSLNRW